MKIGITIAIRNPTISGLSDSFSIYIYRLGTQLVYDRKIGILYNNW